MLFYYRRSHVRTVARFVRNDLGVPLRNHRTPDKERLKCRLSLTTGWWLNCAAGAVPSAFAFAIRAARDAVTRPIPGARPAGQRKRCSKTLLAFLSDAARAFAASCGSPGEVTHLSTVLTPEKPTFLYLEVCQQSEYCSVLRGCQIGKGTQQADDRRDGG